MMTISNPLSLIPVGGTLRREWVENLMSRVFPEEGARKDWLSGVGFEEKVCCCPPTSRTGRRNFRSGKCASKVESTPTSAGSSTGDVERGKAGRKESRIAQV